MEIKTTEQIWGIYQNYEKAIDRGDVKLIESFHNEPNLWVRVDDVRNLIHEKCRDIQQYSDTNDDRNIGCVTLFFAIDNELSRSDTVK